MTKLCITGIANFYDFVFLLLGEKWAFYAEMYFLYTMRLNIKKKLLNVLQNSNWLVSSTWGWFHSFMLSSPYRAKISPIDVYWERCRSEGKTWIRSVINWWHTFMHSLMVQWKRPLGWNQLSIGALKMPLSLYWSQQGRFLLNLKVKAEKNLFWRLKIKLNQFFFTKYWLLPHFFFLQNGLSTEKILLRKSAKKLFEIAIAI